MNQPTDHQPSPGQHLATVSHDGRFWDVYLEFEESARHTPADRYRALLAFSPVDRGDAESTLRTTAVLIEDSYEEVVHRARQLTVLQLAAFLRSVLP